MKTRLNMCVLALMIVIASQSISAVEITEPTPYYLIHSSGLHAAKGSDTRGCLEAANAVSPQMLTFTPIYDGYYTISAPDGTVLSLNGSYNTKFITATTSNQAQFAIERVNDSFVKIRCRSNNKYLGTDAISAGSHIFADKDGASSLHHWFLSENPYSTPPVSETSYFINPDARRQKIEGWGVSLCWWANMCGKWSDEKIDEIVDWLVSPEGLNFNIFRYNIGGGDDPSNSNCTTHHMANGKGLRAEMEGFKDSSDGPFIWTRDEAQRKIMLKIKEKRPDAIFEAFSNSAPWYMTYSGCVAGNTDASKDNLKPEYYREFAEYLVEVCKHYKEEYGIEFRTLDPFNEPMTNYWNANGSQEGCHFDIASQVAFLKVLDPVLKESGLNTVISASDETSVEQSVKDFDGYNKAGVLELVGQWNTHTYTANDKVRAQIASLCREKGIRLWMSEVGAGGSGIDGNLKLAQKLIDDVRHIMPEAWIDWQYIEEGNDQWCLVRAGSFAKATYSRVKNYYIRSHFSRFIKAGYTILSSFDNSSLVALSPEKDELVLVALNSDAFEKNFNISLSMFDTVGNPVAYITDNTHNIADYESLSIANKELKLKIPGAAIITVVMPVTTHSEQTAGFNPQSSYLIVPRLSPTVSLDVTAGKKVVVNSLTFEKSQLWNILPDGDLFTLTNCNGDIITDKTPDYALSVSTVPTIGQNFDIVSLDNDNVYFKILNSSGTKALDLEGEKASHGTGVGVWTYPDLAPVHRQWQFVAVPEALAASVVDLNINENSYPAPVKISTEAGVICVTPISDMPGTIVIYNSNGMMVGKAEISNEAQSFPLAAGIYIVSFIGLTKWASVVAVQ